MENKLPRIIETIDGVEKLCIHCKEYFPATKEFFYAVGRRTKDGHVLLESNCKDCYKQKFKSERVHAKPNNISHRFIGMEPNEYYRRNAVRA
jgi:hypothetical protein